MFMKNVKSDDEENNGCKVLTLCEIADTRNASSAIGYLCTGTWSGNQFNDEIFLKKICFNSDTAGLLKLL